jgi:hypothetical protein
MASSSAKEGQWEIKTCPIIGAYNEQRFRQYGPENTANWYVVKAENSKKQYAMYPVMGRSHVRYLGTNQLVFGSEPRFLFKSIKYAYVVVGNTIFRVDDQFNVIDISGAQLQTSSGPMYFAFLVVNQIVFACFIDSQKIYIYREDTGIFYTVTDPNAPGNLVVDGKLTKPGFIAAFGNRITVSVAESSQFFLSQVNLGGSAFDPATCFTIAGAAVFAQETSIIRQMAVLNNTLYIYLDYETGIWSNSPSRFQNTTFPWTQNSTYNWNFGIANPTSLDVGFGYQVFLAQNKDGLLQFMVSNGGQPERLSDKAIDTLLQRYTNSFGINNPFLSINSNGFLYQYENTIFYRMSGGPYTGAGLLDQEQTANSIEFSFEAKEWHRCIELNGERNRIQCHIYFNFMHLVTVVGDSTVYNMSGQYYYNEVRNPLQSDPQSDDSYLVYPFRYERDTPLIFEQDYSEFEHQWVQVDFVWGESNINFSTAPFENAKFLIAEQALNGQPQYIIDENPDSEGQPIFILGEQGNTPGLNDLTYNALYKPSIELFFSDDGGISFLSADVRQFSQMGVYSWRMRWYQLGASRNRVYRLICVSPVPIVPLGAVMMTRRISGGAY